MARGPVSQSPLQLLEAAAKDVAAADCRGTSTTELGHEILRLRRIIDRLEAVSCTRIRLFESREGYRAQGAASMTSWLREHCGMSGASAFQRTEVARNLTNVPDALPALDDGEIGFGHAVVLARSVSELGQQRIRDVGESLLSAARRLDPDQLRLVTRNVRHGLDPAGALDALQRQHERRRFSISQTMDGTFMVDGLLSIDDGALLRTAIDALSKPVAGDERTAAQRRADALSELAARWMDAEGRGARRRPAGLHLVLTASRASLAGQSAEPAELAGAGAVPLATARRLTCDGVSTTLEVSSNGSPLDVGRTHRTVTPALRLALEHRDKGCAFPGCDRPVSWTEAHHLHHWCEGGETSLANLVLLCRFHHRMVHESGWQLTRTESGSLRASPP